MSARAIDAARARFSQASFTRAWADLFAAVAAEAPRARPVAPWSRFVITAPFRPRWYRRLPWWVRRPAALALARLGLRARPW
jgi:hypothetical protein